MSKVFFHDSVSGKVSNNIIQIVSKINYNAIPNIHQDSVSIAVEIDCLIEVSIK
jgi:hypothetical protein